MRLPADMSARLPNYRCLSIILRRHFGADDIWPMMKEENCVARWHR